MNSRVVFDTNVFVSALLFEQSNFDRERDHYLIMLVGRDGIRRVHGCLVHVDLIDGDSWIQRDGIERGIARDLIAAGVSQEQIVLAFRSPEWRRQADFAA